MYHNFIISYSIFLRCNHKIKLRVKKFKFYEFYHIFYKICSQVQFQLTSIIINNYFIYCMKQSRKIIFTTKKKKSLATNPSLFQPQKSIQQQAQDKLIEISNQGIPQLHHSLFEVNLIEDFHSVNSKQKKKNNDAFLFSPKSAYQDRRSFVKQNLQISTVKKSYPKRRSNIIRQIETHKCSRLIENKQKNELKTKSLKSNKRLLLSKMIPSINMSDFVNFIDPQLKERQVVFISEEKAASRNKSQRKINQKVSILQTSQRLTQNKRELVKKFSQNLNLKNNKEQNASSNLPEKCLQKGGVFSRLKQVFDSNKLKIVNLKFPIYNNKIVILNNDPK